MSIRRTTRRLRGAFLVPLAAVLLAACAAPDQGAASANETCPVMGGPVDPARTLVVDGRPVAFCCQDCILQWIAMDPAEQKARLAEVMPER